ncbi:MAG TPA: Pr6Pr family membrane protein [Homoserinimonas sp.]|nr:Pr6Pr family membrane protein [Homoserinimonas sp.]
MRRVFGVARILVALTGIAALAGDFNYSLGTNPLAIGNFFSYFTVQSALIAVTVFVMGAVYGLRNQLDPLWLEMVRILMTVWVIVSGIVFAVILVEGSLRGVPVWAPWSSQLLHFWIPAYALIDWLIAPGRDVPWRTVGYIMVFPLAWVFYTMIRGSLVHWYPYFFLDPLLVDFPFEFALYLCFVIVIFTGVAAGVIAISRLPRFEHLRERWSRNRPRRSRFGLG